MRKQGGGRRAKGEGSVYQRKDGRWVGELDLGYEGGRRQRQPFYGRTQAEALERLNLARRNLFDGKPAVDSRVALGLYLKTWLDGTVDPSTLKPSTKASYRYIVTNHIVPVLDRVPLGKLRPTDVQSLLKKKQDEGFSDRTRQLIHATLRRALQHAVRYELIPRNPAASVDAPRPRRDTTKVHPLTLDQMRALNDAAADTRLHVLWLVLGIMGLRKGEALGLRWTDIDLATGTMKIERTLSRVQAQGLVFGATKSSYSERGTFIPPVIQTGLQRHWADQEIERLRAGSAWSDNGLVFTTKTGRPIEPSNLNRQFDTLCKMAGIGHERVHNLRHTAATLLRAYGGADLQDVKDILGHSTIAITVDQYGHEVPVLQRALMQRVSSLFEGVGDPQAVN